MNFLGVGPAELLVILIIALLVFGPSRLPQVAKDLGKTIGKARQALDEIQSVTEAPLKEVKELKEALDPAAVEKKLQESVQQIVSQEPPSQRKDGDQAPADQVEEKQPEAEEECRT
ncbi:MAG TPA: twin-arginine translocase TatA/TatE family subunit [Anaerolineae bacterium]|jgi:TatA/E family protein of Tat protein translocase|nr:twin-arginine translocase TatA/TatE family subunit [Anaerolineae bacterium]